MNIPIINNIADFIIFYYFYMKWLKMPVFPRGFECLPISVLFRRKKKAFPIFSVTYAMNVKKKFMRFSRWIIFTDTSIESSSIEHKRTVPHIGEYNSIPIGASFNISTRLMLFLHIIYHLLDIKTFFIPFNSN